MSAWRLRETNSESPPTLLSSHPPQDQAAAVVVYLWELYQWNQEQWVSVFHHNLMLPRNKTQSATEETVSKEDDGKCCTRGQKQELM